MRMSLHVLASTYRLLPGQGVDIGSYSTQAQTLMLTLTHKGAPPIIPTGTGTGKILRLSLSPASQDPSNYL